MCTVVFTKTVNRAGFVLFLSLISSVSFAVSANPKVTAEDMTCGKETGISLSEFKGKLAASCDLSKPFSSSLSRLLNDDTYFYCCQKAK